MSSGKVRHGWFRLLCTLVIVLLSASLFSASNAQGAGIAMTLPNASFEDAGTGIPHWYTHPIFGTATATVSTEKAYTGASSMKMVDTGSSSLARVSEKIAITSTSNVAYTASAFTFLEQGAIDVYLIFYSGTTETRVAPNSVTPVYNQWSKRTITAEAPAGATDVAVMIYSGMGSVTTAYIDDVSIGKTVKNSGFETALSGTWTVTGAALSTTVKNRGAYSLKLDNTGLTTSSSAESTNVPVASGNRIGASARVYVSAGTDVSLGLRFKNASGTVVKEVANDFKGPLNTWTPVSVSASAPTATGAQTVSVYLTSKAGATTVAYVDDVSLDLPIVYPLGTAVTNNPLDGAVFSKDASGSYDLMFVGSSGYPSKFIVYDARTGELIDDQNLDQTEAVWGMTVATDQSVFIGTANKKALYRYIPGTVSVTAGKKTITGSSLVKTTLPNGLDVIWDVTAGSGGSVYGGTAANGKAFYYQPSTGVTVLNSNQPIVSGLAHVRSIAYASDTEVFMGMGSTSNATIIRFNPVTGTQSTISPSGMGSSYVLSLDYIPNGSVPKLFAKLSSDPLIVLDSATGTYEASLGNVDSIGGVSMKHPTDDKVFYTKGTVLYSYDLSDKTQTNLGDVGGKAAGYTFLTDGGNTYLYASLTSGKILKYKLAAIPTIDTSTTFAIPESPTKIRSLVKGPSNDIYTSGYLRGGLSVYRPSTGLFTRNKGAGQAENMTTIGNQLYLGIYPGAWIKKYDTTSPWNDTTNPNLLFQDIAGSPNYQDRPFGMLADPSLNRLYVGTVAASGKTSGAFTVYDLTTSQKVTTVLDIVDHQSIISLAQKNTQVFGGSSVSGGIGSTQDPSIVEGKVFTWQTTGTNTLPVPQFVPVPGRKAISDLIAGPDGLIWGLAEGNSSTDSSRNLTADLFIFDPDHPDASHTTVYANKFASTGNVSWQGGKMVVGNDGNVYVSIGGHLYAVNAGSATKDAVIVVPNGVSLLAADAEGDLYFVKYETNLYKYDK